MTTPPPKADRRAWWGLALLALPTAVLGIDMTVLHLAVPEMSEDLRPSSSELLWSIDAYGFLIAGFLITMGTLGDRIGRRTLLLIGATAFALISVVSSMADSPEMLIATRALLGVSGATLMPSTLSLLRSMFPDDNERIIAISVWGAAFFGGMGFGPVAGGLVLKWGEWSDVFLIAVPVMVALVVLGPLLLPDPKDPSPGRLDLISVALSLAGVIGVIYGLKQIAEHGTEVDAVVAMVVGALLVVVFLDRQRRIAAPLLDLALFRNRGLSAGLAAQTLAVIAMGGTQFFIGQYLQLTLGQSPLEAGVWTAIPVVAGIVSISMAPSLAQRYAPGLVLAGGLVIAAVGFGLLIPVVSGESLTLVVVGYSVIWFGSGPVFALAADLIVGAAPPAKAGSAGALSETGNEFGFALGIGVVGTAGMAVYRRQLDVDGVPEEATEAARDSLGGAMETAGGLPGSASATLLDNANQAFADGMAASAGIGAAICVVAAVVAATALRNVTIEHVSHDTPAPALSDE